MEIVFETAFTDDHFEQILQLQKQNLYTSLTKEQQAQQGFVFAEHDMERLKIMAAEIPQVVALHQGRVIGYNLAMTRGMKEILPILVPMFEEFEKTSFKGKLLGAYSFMVGGQVCVNAEFRGQGLLSKLYHETRNRISKDYELCVTEISSRNPNSLKTHQKMGFQIAGTYHDGKEPWNVVVWELAADNVIAASGNGAQIKLL